MDNPNITYITQQEAVDFIKWFSELSNLEQSLIIFSAENIIDSYIWNCWEKENLEQERIFPTKEHWLPNDIKYATLYITKDLFNDNKSWNKEIIEEKHWTSSYKYWINTKETTSDRQKGLDLLKGFICGKFIR